MELLGHDGLRAATENKPKVKVLSGEEQQKLQDQNKRPMSSFKQEKLLKEVHINWDKFYKRNEQRFFKNRHWTMREFENFLQTGRESQTLLEVGCGVGNFVFPLVEAGLEMIIKMCDFSPRAIELVKQHPHFNSSKMDAFVCDISSGSLGDFIMNDSVDIVSMIFVLSSIDPRSHASVLKDIWRVLKPGGVLLFRDYGLFDAAQIRFGPGHKICEKLYVRQDGTLAYYFEDHETEKLFMGCGFQMLDNRYVQRITENKQKGIQADRIFIQGIYTKADEVGLTVSSP